MPPRRRKVERSYQKTERKEIPDVFEPMSVCEESGVPRYRRSAVRERFVTKLTLGSE